MAFGKDIVQLDVVDNDGGGGGTGNVNSSVTPSFNIKEGMIAYIGTFDTSVTPKKPNQEPDSTNSGVIYKDTSRGSVLYYADINNLRYYWDIKGKCVNMPTSSAVDLYVLSGSVTSSDVGGYDTSAATGGTTVKALNARDNFANEALQALIQMHPNPIDSNPATSVKLANKAYEYAEAMLNASIRYRSQDEASASGSAVAVDTSALNTTSERLLNNIAVALESLNGGVKVKNPLDGNNDPIEFEVSGGSGGSGGGGSSTPVDVDVDVTFDTAAVKEALVNNLDYTTLNYADNLGYILGFYKNASNKYIPTVNTLLQLRQLIELNIKATSNALLHWITVYNSNTPIESISDFLNAYKDDFISAIKTSWRGEIKTIILEVLNSLEYNASLNVSATRTSITNKNVSTDSDWV